MTGEQKDETGDEAEEPSEDPAERLNLPDGPGGILTDTDRVFLLHDHPEFPELEWEGDENQKRWRIREKVKTALQDFTLLERLDDDELQLILDDVYADENSAEHTISASSSAQYNHLLSMMGFVYRACNVSPVDFESLIEATIRDQIPKYRGNAPLGQGQRSVSVDVQVDIDVDVEWEDVLDADEIEEKLERGEPITREEVGELFLQDRLEPGEIGADDVDPSLFRVSSPGNRGFDTLPGLNPPSPTRSDDWEEQLRAILPEEIQEQVSWEAAQNPQDVWLELEQYYDDPVKEVTQRNREERT